MLHACLPLLAVLGEVIAPGDGAKLLGWSADGGSLVWTTVEIGTSSEGDDHDSEDERAVIATVYDARRGQQQRYLVEYAATSKAGRTTGALKKKHAGLLDAAAFEAWKASHPLSKVAGRQGPSGGKATVKVTLVDDVDGAERKRETMKWTVANTATVRLEAACGADTAAESLAQQMDAMYQPRWSATPYWDPTGRRVAFLLDEAVVKTMRGTAGGGVMLAVVPCGPRVDVLAPAGLEAAAGPVADAVEKAGLTVVSIGVAKTPRATTVIYADRAHMDAAAKLASAIPGGATVDKLTWKPKADVVVAIGDSAR